LSLDTTLRRISPDTAFAGGRNHNPSPGKPLPPRAPHRCPAPKHPEPDHLLAKNRRKADLPVNLSSHRALHSVKLLVKRTFVEQPFFTPPRK
jgi:hypothetical protein